jgi:hypothetical protein
VPDAVERGAESATVQELLVDVPDVTQEDGPEEPHQDRHGATLRWLEVRHAPESDEPDIVHEICGFELAAKRVAHPALGLEHERRSEALDKPGETRFGSADSLMDVA